MKGARALVGILDGLSIFYFIAGAICIFIAIGDKSGPAFIAGIVSIVSGILWLAMGRVIMLLVHSVEESERTTEQAREIAKALQWIVDNWPGKLPSPQIEEEIPKIKPPSGGWHK